MLVALAAAYVASQRPAAILSLVAASFSLAGAAFVPAMVLGIFWKRTTRMAAVSGMLSGLCMTLYYMVVHSAPIRAALGAHAPTLWFDIAPISAGVFGVATGFLTVVVVSLVLPERTSQQAAALKSAAASQNSI
jgi:cation/acetate symporter